MTSTKKEDGSSGWASANRDKSCAGETDNPSQTHGVWQVPGGNTLSNKTEAYSQAKGSMLGEVQFNR